ncbi:hypothetical protein C4577_04410 [Candidatus Parcubacteria bacterium]|nr:MAG: hypothetical protein C4577_04410 [Candidatus Parcubacteria bacterium]
MFLVSYLFNLVLFWYKDAVFSLINYFVELDRYIIDLLSTPILVHTFFDPIKNEYRKGLVGFSIGLGIFIKTLILIPSFAILLLVFILEFIALIIFLFFPFIPLYVLIT